jgi:hypothetical protein
LLLAFPAVDETGSRNKPQGLGGLDAIARCHSDFWRKLHSVRGDECKGRKTAPVLAPRGKTLSIRDLPQQLSLKRHTDITLAFGYYLERFTDVHEFTPADINNCYYEIRVTR